MSPPGRGDWCYHRLAEVVVDEEHCGWHTLWPGQLKIRFKTEDIEFDETPQSDQHQGDNDGNIVVSE